MIAPSVQGSIAKRSTMGTLRQEHWRARNVTEANADGEAASEFVFLNRILLCRRARLLPTFLRPIVRRASNGAVRAKLRLASFGFRLPLSRRSGRARGSRSRAPR